MANNVLKFLALAAISLGAIQGASAADLPRKAMPYPAPAAAYDWSGIYLGAEAGGLWGKFSGDFLTPPPASLESRRTTGAAGGFIGAQYQFSNNIVLGGEADFIALFKKSLGSSACTPASSCGPDALRTVSLDPIWSAGARLGYAVGMWMPYATGGFAGTKMHLLGTDSVPTNESVSQNRYGWYAGGGIDWAVGYNWVLGFEYRHYDFGTEVAVPFDNLIGAFAVFDATRVRLTADTAMVRASYKFGGMSPR